MTTVSFLVDKLIRGGGESLLLDLISELKDEIDFRIWCLGKIDNDVEADLLEHGVEPLRVRSIPYSGREKYALKPLPPVVQRLQQEEVDILHGYSLYCNFLSRIATSVVRGVKTVSQHHGVQKTLSLSKIANVLTNPLSDCTICVSETVAESIYSISHPIGKLVASSNIRIIHNPVDFQFIQESSQQSSEVLDRYGLEGHDQLLVSVGRLTESKNHRCTIRTMAKLGDSAPHLVIVGGGDLEKELEQQIHDLSIENQVTLLGQVNRQDCIAIVSEGTMFISSSIREGFGIALAEAMALGKPIVASDIGAYREIGDESAMEYFPPRNADELANRIKKLQSSPQKMEQQAKRAKEIATEYRIENVADQYRSIYLSLV